MPNNIMDHIIIIGAGPMAVAYGEALSALNKPYTAIGRGEQSALAFQEKTGVMPFVGGLDNYLSTHEVEGAEAIIATGTEVLLPTMLALLKAGVSRILIEKPAAISIQELLLHREELLAFGDNVYVAYNRRFYGAVFEAQRLIDEDGGLLTLNFEFTEWSHIIAPLTKAPGVKDNWFFANSTHVVDLAFYLAGRPTDWKSYSKKGTLDWHEKSNFVGAGITETGTLFSYCSNWESPGRWAVELLTKNRRIYLKPMESLKVQQKGKVILEDHDFDDSLDKLYKPGVYLQLQAFLNGEQGRLLRLRDHIDNCEVYSKILADQES